MKGGENVLDRDSFSIKNKQMIVFIHVSRRGTELFLNLDTVTRRKLNPNGHYI